MELLSGMVEALVPPWNKKNRSLLIESPMLPPTQWEGTMQNPAYVLISDLRDGLKGQLGCIHPFTGLGVYTPDFEVCFQGHSCNQHCQPGTWVGFQDFWVSNIIDNKITVVLTDESSLWTIPDYDTAFPVSFLHMFCGGFNGWERGTKWFEFEKLFTIQQEVSIDHNEQALKLWQLRTKGELCCGKIGINHDCKQKHLGIVAACNQNHWMNTFRFGINGFFTCSPPCPSWSRGGRGQGLECENGVAFAACIQKIRALRPIAAFCECADKLIAHPHYKILRASFQAAGYKMLWTGVIPYDTLAPMYRTRWLAIWIRADVPNVQLGSFKLNDVQKEGWSSSIYDFPVPSQVQHQMKLTSELCETYGDPCLLPTSKKLNGNPTKAEVLEARCIRTSDPLPTLCAMYSQQHHIDANHLQNKGIFAALQCFDGNYQFFSPLLFVALLGAVVTEPVFLPAKIDLAFLFLGNAIAVPHAVLTLAIGFVATKFLDQQVSQIVLKAWANCFTTSNTIVLRSQDFVIMCPLWYMNDVLPIHHCCMRNSRANWKITIGNQSILICVDDHTTICDIFKQIGIETNALKNVMVSIDQKAVQWATKVVHLPDSQISLTKQNVRFLTCKIDRPGEASDCDSLDCAILGEIEMIEASCDQAMHKPILPVCEAMQDEMPSKRVCIRQPEADPIEQRTLLFVHQGIPLATDELDWIIRVIASKQKLSIHQIIESEWCNIEKNIIDIVARCVDNMPIKCMILFDNHWFAIEVRRHQAIEFFCINAPRKLKPCLTKVFEKCEGINGFSGSFGFSESSFEHGFCGWELVVNWFGIVIPQSQICPWMIQDFLDSNGPIAGKKPTEKRLLVLWEIVCCARFQFLTTLPNNHCINGIKIGLANDDQVMKDVQSQQPPDSADPWMQPGADPWNQAKKSCKWEDLKLPDDHHFKDVKGKQIAQLHRHQITANTFGIAFATKSCVVDIFNLNPPKQTALLLPNSEKLHFPQFPNLSITGPFEVVVRDQGLNSIYKRQVLLVQAESEIQFQLPKAAYSATTTEFKELVVEIDERLIPKDLASAIIAKPLDVIKSKLIEQIPPLASKSLGVFGFRLIKMHSNKESHNVFQAICKIHADQRSTCLERSGAGDVFIRDFIPKGELIDDLTIVPRFWQTDRISKDEALRMAASISGFAGLVHTRRGIAVRAWCKNVACVRKIILAHHDRICSLNQAVIPRVLRDSTGWPAAVGPQEIVRATNHAVGIPPIPTRCYKAQGVTSWTLAFDATPKIDKFMVQINEKTFEIILTMPNEKMPSNTKAKNGKTPKGSGKGKKDTTQETLTLPSDDPNSQRITSLEAKFAAMERRQDSLEGKINDGFMSVNDQLRQVLHAIQPRGTTTQTGMTPPPKIPKTL